MIQHSIRFWADDEGESEKDDSINVKKKRFFYDLYWLIKSYFNSF